MAMKTSKMGIAFLERHEGVVLKAYRDPVGIWTIGPGLTAKSGVVSPHAGMRISAEESERLTQKALARNYEPTVRKAMTGAKQHEFDAAVSFHWNTGAILRASWVKSWRKKVWEKVKLNLMRWTKAGGRVFPGLKRRREEEYSLLRHAIYGAAPVQSASRGGRHAKILVNLSMDELTEVRNELHKLGYDPGHHPAEVLQEAVRAFQRDHDLTVDGVLGRATFSTLRRRIDARRKATAASLVGVAGGTEAAGSYSGLPMWVLLVALSLIAVWVLYLAWDYRDAIAAKVQRKLPRLAAWLRSF